MAENSGGRELGQADAVGHIVEHDAHRHVTTYGIRRDAGDGRKQARPFVQLDHRHHVRHVFRPPLVIEALVGNEAEHPPGAIDLFPRMFATQAMGASRGGRKPECIAGLALFSAKIFS